MRVSRSFARRTFLGQLAAGAGAALVPFLDGAARATSASRFPRRLLVMVTSNGTIQERFWPSGREQDFKFPKEEPDRPSIIAPLERSRSDLLFVRGIEMKSAADDRSVHGGHNNFVHLLVGGAPAHPKPHADPKYGVTAGGAGDMSVDHYIARATLPPTPFPLLTLGVMVQWGSLAQARISWHGRNQPVSPIEDPYRLFDQLFGTNALAPEALDRLRRQRRSLLDLVGASLQRQARRLGGEDRARLLAHLEGVRTIERQLEPARARLPGGAPAIPNLTGDRVATQDMRNFPVVGRLQMDLAVAALASDATRIVTFQWANASNDNVVFSWLGDDFHGKGDEFPVRHHHDITHVARRGPDHLRRKCLAERWFIEQLAYLIDKLRSVPEGDGTLLDNTLLLFANNMHDGGNHTHGPALPWIFAGGGGYLRPGRFVDLGNQTVTHQRVLASVCEYMGADPTRFGLPRYNAGPLPHLRGPVG